MNKLVELRSQESLCRERAANDVARRNFWLTQAEEWEKRALEEIALHFRECNISWILLQPTTH
jgi:hypothetical protein